MKRDRRIREAIDVSLKRDTTVRELAAHVRMSRARFSHLFALETGVLPSEHLRILRKHRGEKRFAREIFANFGVIID